jgi:fatty acid desaturase
MLRRRRFDWMLPEAWNVEHNNLHHYTLGEVSDPDLVEHNAEQLRMALPYGLPNWLKYGVIGVAMATWKWFYYAPNTYKELKVSEYRRANRPLPKGFDPHLQCTLWGLLDPNTPSIYGIGELFSRVVGPYFLIHFFLFPAPFLLISSQAYLSAVVNLLIADVLSNIHTFIIVVTNHTGDDMYCFDESCTPLSGNFYMRAVISSVNFACGDDVTDFLHGWLNYQIEHHAWPKLSMLQYRKAQPLMKALCAKHHIPYIQQSVWTRLRKTVDIMIGNTSMRKFPTGVLRETCTETTAE